MTVPEEPASPRSTTQAEARYPRHPRDPKRRLCDLTPTTLAARSDDFEAAQMVHLKPADTNSGALFGVDTKVSAHWCFVSKLRA
jgi:hypothetical protein